MKSLYLKFCKIRFQLSRLFMPLEPIVYDTKFRLGSQSNHYERYFVTRELRGYRLWRVCFFISCPLHIKKIGLFHSKFLAILAVRANNKFQISAIQSLFAHNRVASRFNKIELGETVRIIAELENLDEFLKLESAWPGWVEYATKHGKRYLNIDNPEQSKFDVCEDGNGFAKPVALRYSVFYSECITKHVKRYLNINNPESCKFETYEYSNGFTEPVALPYSFIFPNNVLISHIPQFEREARALGYGIYQQLPYAAIPNLDYYSIRNLVVLVAFWDEQILDTGYANVVPLEKPCDELETQFINLLPSVLPLESQSSNPFTQWAEEVAAEISCLSFEHSTNDRLYVLLAGSIKSASEMAYMLRGKWDRCNGILLSQPIDEAAINLAVELEETEFCESGDYCHFYPQGIDTIVDPQFKQMPDNLTEQLITGIELYMDDSPF